ncbi:uncharacterized protein LOC143809951 [Ranitomeya variabilis]|uniref:uncharacterized protein LOC143809951 n=1 Tax=Ranitomeya variabilis TaxID=490064 RepID=UPI004057B969
MSSRELRQLIEDNEVWLSRPQNQGQATIVHRLRSSQRHQGRHSNNDGQQRFSNSGTERRGRCARAPPHHRRQERNTGRSRSPKGRVPLEPLRITGPSSRDDEQASDSSATTTALEIQLPDTILHSGTTRELPAPFRTTRESCMNDGYETIGSADTIIEFELENLILPRGRFSEVPNVNNIYSTCSFGYRE